MLVAANKWKDLVVLSEPLKKKKLMRLVFYTFVNPIHIHDK